MKTLNDVLDALENATDTLRSITGNDTPKAVKPVSGLDKPVKDVSQPTVKGTRVNLRTDDGSLHFQVKKPGQAKYSKHMVSPTNKAYNRVADSDEETRNSFANTTTQYLVVEDFVNTHTLGSLIEALESGDDAGVNDWIEEYVY